MNKRSMPVDFGPIALELNTLHDGWQAAGPGASSRREDAIRLQRLLRGASDEGANAGEVEGLEGRQICPGHTGISLPPGQAPDRVASCLKQASSVAAATSNIATRVELSLSPDLLPRTSLSVEKSREGFRFDLRVSDAQARDGLMQNLETIVADVGKHLQEPISLRLFDGSMTAPCRVAVWRPGGLE